MQAHKLIEFPSEYERLYTDYQAAHDATVEAWLEEIAAAKALHDSGTWKAFAPTWEKYCSKELGFMPYAASTYRQAQMNAPLAELIATVANTTVSREQANNLGRKLNEVIPEAERPSMKLSVLALCLAYDETKPVPDKNVIAEAYNILKEERDNNSISVNGETFDYKESAQVQALKARVAQDIQAHSKQVTIAIEGNRQIGLFLRFLRRLGYNVPSENKKLYVSWKG